MNNRDRTYAKVLLALAIGFSFAAEVANYTINEKAPFTENQTEKKEVQERASASIYQDKISFWE
ncbi:hypothetical protein ACFS7Z_23050 [Pontibacter toksunensis]|uniref:Uncharacterized protein n=1 Tax=Pontibacter toksunensis TaxID=1332631 RepID=A0ABW6C3T3_9BACT